MDNVCAEDDDDEDDDDLLANKRNVKARLVGLICYSGTFFCIVTDKQYLSAMQSKDPNIQRLWKLQNATSKL